MLIRSFGDVCTEHDDESGPKKRERHNPNLAAPVLGGSDPLVEYAKRAVDLVRRRVKVRCKAQHTLA